MLALARFIGIGLAMTTSSDDVGAGDSGAPAVEGWLLGMERVVEEQGEELARLA